ncbi:MAG TPA: SGNH hydrolase domain-containing protein, partial [Solirubrobacteraceae bacterium]|nr:SGNH hydrolase domain-containing protein [Solirubrobacteraceae bacterium]
CAFGVAPEEASETIALIGDSHAAHWRAAIDVVVAEKRWHGISFTKAGCPLSTAITDIPAPGKTKCIRWKRQLFRWFEKHPEIRTVITSNHTGGKVVGANGRDYSAHVEGYTQALAKLPPSVERIFSIRDVPRNSRNSMDCVARAIRRKIAAGPKCAVPREFALKRDPATPAARRSDPRRVQLIDMTRFMCSERMCLPVIGGALVHKDETHLTRVFATTLGPYLLRHIDRALAHMAAGTRP